MIPRRYSPIPRRSRKPRASGDDPGLDVIVEWAPQVNPARAGMIRIHATVPWRSEGKPRASGDDPMYVNDAIGFRM